MPTAANAPPWKLAGRQVRSRERPVHPGFRAVRRALGALLSFEAAFLVFLFSGIYKIDPRLAWFPVDLTMFFFAVTLVLGVAIICREGIFLAGLATVTVAVV